MKLVFAFLLLACACSSAETFPPPLQDCDGSCKDPVIIDVGSEGGVKDVATSDVDDAASIIDSNTDVVDTDAGD